MVARAKQIEWPADKVERRAIDTLVPFARNARTHTTYQIEQIAASMREWGWTNPVLIDEDSQIIAGHGRVLAAKSLGLATAPVLVARGWSDKQKRAYLIADNKIAINAGWDEDLLAVEFSDLRDFNFDLDLIGFSGAEVAAILTRNMDPIDIDAEWQGMPDYDQPNQEYRKIIMNFADQKAVDNFAKLLGQEITDRTRFLHFPKQDKLVMIDKRYAADA